MFPPQCIWKISCKKLVALQIKTLKTFQEIWPCFLWVSDGMKALVGLVIGLSCCFCMQLFCLKPWWCAVQLLGVSLGLDCCIFSCPSQSQNKALRRIMFRMACLAETCCFIIAWGSRSKCILALLKWGNLFPYFSIQFILIFMTFYEVIFSSNRCMVSVHQTVRTVLNRSHLSPACCCSLLWPQYEPHMTAEADHKVQEYCYLPKLSDPKLCIQARFLFHSEENKEIIER